MGLENIGDTNSVLLDYGWYILRYQQDAEVTAEDLEKTRENVRQSLLQSKKDESYNAEYEKEWESEIEEMQKKMEEHMRRYEKNLKHLFSSALSDVQEVNEKDADYFIREYNDKFICRNPDNIKNRLQLYNKYLKEQN